MSRGLKVAWSSLVFLIAALVFACGFLRVYALIPLASAVVTLNVWLLIWRSIPGDGEDV